MRRSYRPTRARKTPLTTAIPRTFGEHLDNGASESAQAEASTTDPPNVQRSVLSFLLVFLASAAIAPARADAEPSVGVMFDAGVPDGAQGAVVFHPLGWLRLHAGGGYNMVSPGVRAGLSVIRPSGGVRPCIVLEAGRFFEGDANPLMRQLTGEPEYHKASLSNVGYDWASAHVGLEFGTDWLRFFLHAGLSEVRSSVHDAESLTSMNEGRARFEEDLRISGHVPSGRLGLIFYLP
jgi:hypothetical protein